MVDSSYQLVQTNYSQKNPVIRLLLKNFVNKLYELLSELGAKQELGLDAGCGEGHLIGRLHARRVIGKIAAVDASNDHLSYAIKTYPCCEYTAADLSHLPFPANTFDYILSTEVFEHLMDPRRAMKELRRVGKKGAHLIISIPFEPFFHWGNLVRGKYWYRGGYTPDHRNLWHRQEFGKFLAPFVTIDRDFSYQTFPWLLFRCRFR